MRLSFILFMLLPLSVSCRKQETPSSFFTDFNWIMTHAYFWSAHATKQIALLDVSQYSETQPAAYLRQIQAPEDRFSFVISRDEYGLFLGKPKDIGLLIRYLNDTAYVAYVEPHSPAQKAGIKRSMWIKSLRYASNPAKTTLTPNKAGRRIPFELNEKVYVTVANRGSSHLREVALEPATYETEAIGATMELEVAGQKVAYFHLSNFLADDTHAALERLFATYKAKGIRSLIVDLRYNGGGYVDQSQLLASLIYHPGDDVVFCRYEYGASQNHRKETVPFVKEALSLRATRCLFIVDVLTASASELIINAFKGLSAQMDMRLIGATTVGKNVGSSAYQLPNRSAYTHVLFPITFRSSNHAGHSDYGDGFRPDYVVFDDVRFPLGDVRAPRLSAALHYIEHGRFPSTPLAYKSPPQPQALIDARSYARLNGLSLSAPTPTQP